MKKCLISAIFLVLLVGGGSAFGAASNQPFLPPAFQDICANKCKPEEDPCRLNQDDCYTQSSTYRNAYEITQVSKCVVDSVNLNKCHWILQAYDQDKDTTCTSAIGEVCGHVCAPGLYKNDQRCKSDTNSMLTCCTGCDESISDDEGRELTSNIGAIGEEECFVKSETKTIGDNGCDTGYRLYNGGCYQEYTDGNGNTYILAADCMY